MRPTEHKVNKYIIESNRGTKDFHSTQTSLKGRMLPISQSQVIVFLQNNQSKNIKHSKRKLKIR